MTDMDLPALDRELKIGAAELLPTGQRALARPRRTWDEFVEALRMVTRGEHA
jgi:hypothetical protein